jgi:hypothetical protein
LILLHYLYYKAIFVLLNVLYEVRVFGLSCAVLHDVDGGGMSEQDTAIRFLFSLGELGGLGGSKCRES